MSIKEHAFNEMTLAGFDFNDRLVILNILDIFFKEWDSGTAAMLMAQVLLRCLLGKPLSPLTGNPDEWMEVSDGIRQNKRCSSVFDNHGVVRDIDNPNISIKFPYSPHV